MAVKIFLTGATGYIGGTALDYIVRAHPGYEYTVLVRDEFRAEPIIARYPSVKFAYGTLEDDAVLKRQPPRPTLSSVHTADSSDHYAGAMAIAKGLKDGHTAEKPGFWIHTSGTSILTWYDAEHKRAGGAPLPEQKYHDIKDIERLISLPDGAHHRDVDEIALAANSDAVKVVILCPPTIYGTGAGAVNTRSRQVPSLARATLNKGFAPIIGEGKTEWDHVHSDDLGDLYVKLVDATQDPARRGNTEILGPHAYFFAENGSHSWAEVAHWIADEASRQGYLPSPLTKLVSEKEVTLMEDGSVSWGRNSKGVAERARKYLGWQPKGVPLKDTIREVVAKEAQDLGLTPKRRRRTEVHAGP
ncbi:Uncharacterized protein TPAR_02112 [Tolypocladium paradoxum]|uniref:NAD-dependent epimerase/dehydratase domain-containing protein n=1 Tax=Tolypocladium paradoxum TaxID=94208 RepID=A0A2S4L5J9_9HYPO|nr:Uncharacterized protein TPAR_02112 [Tolypocladium paradoxum]